MILKLFKSVKMNERFLYANKVWKKTSNSVGTELNSLTSCSFGETLLDLFVFTFEETEKPVFDDSLKIKLVDCQSLKAVSIVSDFINGVKIYNKTLLVEDECLNQKMVSDVLSDNMMTLTMNHKRCMLDVIKKELEALNQAAMDYSKDNESYHIYQSSLEAEAVDLMIRWWKTK